MGRRPELDSKLEEEPKVTAETVKQLSFAERLKIYSALTHSTRLDLLRTLARKNPNSFTDLKAKHDLNPNTLAYHLKALEYAGLIRSRYEKEEGNPKYSHYEITGLGKEMLAVDDYTKWL